MRSLAAVAFALLAFPVLGQQASQPDKTPGANERPKPAPRATTKDRVTAESQISDSVERIGENHIKRIGHVEFVQGDSSLYADEVEIFQDENRAIATGNVVLTQGTNRIAADRADFNTETMLGTFYKAWGLATIQPPKQTARPGGGLNAPTQSGAETDVYFYGDEIVKQGPKKYRITNGGFTTCVQPTPRWHLTSKTTVLNIDHYTLLREAVFNVKGVPLLYTPFLYYPTKKDRATGFLIPTYGTSTVRGHALHNAFFWAVDRSEDVTVMHDWFSNQAQGVGAGIPVQLRRRFERRHHHLLARSAADHRHGNGREHESTAGHPELRDSGQRQPAAVRQLPRSRSGRLLLRPDDDADVQYQHL